MTDAPRSSVPATAGATTPEHPWPVRLLTAKMAAYISRMPVTWVEGQLVELVRRPGSGTAYLTLRDADVDLSLSVTVNVRVLDALGDGLTQGARVVVRAKPELWTKRGTLQLVADQVRPVGVGELLARIEHLKRLLAAEGLLDPARRKALPFLPRTVGLVCGRASAAERDVVVTARSRWPGVRFDIRQVVVQGPGAVAAVTEAVLALDGEPEVDVIVVARGGGSLEDLLPFSNETLLRAVAACRTPVVSAIGHEVDTPLLDLVADLRASTPTDAGRRVVPAVAEELTSLAQARGRLRRALVHRLDVEAAHLASLRARPVLTAPARGLDERASVVAGVRERGRRALRGRLERAGDEVAHLGASVRALSPASTLERGYAVVRTAQGLVVRTAGQVGPGDPLRVRLAAGELEVAVTATHPVPGSSS